MPNLKDLKKRIGTVKNTQQTTKAMKMVSAAKLRRAQEAIVGHRPYARGLGRLMRLIATMSETPMVSSLIQAAGSEKPQSERNLLLVVVTSDRGLCGAFNSNIIRRTERWLRENEGSYGDVKLAFVGRKGHDYFKLRYADRIEKYLEFGPKATFVQAERLTSWIIEQFNEKRTDEVKFVYNEFKNAITQEFVMEEFLPVAEAPMAEAGKDDHSEAELYIVKPSREEVLRRLLERHFAIQCYRILLESQASEHGARMSAMENATKNAGEMIEGLTLLYNKTRQAAITKEILEITSGSEALKG